ncbi:MULTISPECIES: PIN domain-containing protein [unclassified Rhodococcus (in: high G+C Gram-positive bacteria)]|uniref:PIN domain-containing protein n=1 Tax=unclassified Rhodococcus (in: high G+C Gram-positive bacteria) TaxID=192944 RepID=UPI00096A9902|nr:MULTISPECIES: PIN domain-containing protein [unclassified Rhodococcus (in: high G+C Gram-positive bacteria)]
MTVRPIIDAGPALNFLAINKERLLLATTGPISTPETVRNEVLSKSAKDRRFAQVERVWNKIPSRLLDVLPDDPTPELIAVLGRISQQPWKQRLATAKDLGETMVIAHAVVHAEAGHQVTVIIDDQGGAALATTEIRRLSRLRQMGKPVGGIALVNTVTILEKAAGGIHLPDKGSMREIYTKLRKNDDGLLPIDRTQLLSSTVWK